MGLDLCQPGWLEARVAQTTWQDLLSEASRLRVAGRVDEAIMAYERLLRAKPDLADSWYNLGFLQRRARRFKDALDSYAKALDHGIADPEEVHVNRAVIYSDHLFRPDEAGRELDRALGRNPRYVPALLNLGNLCEDLGDRDGARAAYLQALEVEPGNLLALSRLAGVSHSAELDQTLAASLRDALARPGLSPADQADLGFALAGLLNAAGRHDDAFAVVADANAASRLSAGTAARYDRDANERLIDRLIAAFDSPVPADSVDTSPLFICGMFRSGSTLVEQVLARHSHVTAGGELELIPSLAAKIPSYPESVPKADAATIAAWRQAYLNGLPELPRVGHGVTDKRPDNFLHIGLIKTLFPGAKIIHTFRNPLDNLLSLYFLHLDPSMAYALDLDDAAHWYGQYRRLMEHWRRLYPADIIDVDYDSLVREPRAVIEVLTAACGLPWEEALLDAERSTGPVKTASVWQVRQPIHARSSGRWRDYARQLDGVRKQLAGAKS